MKSVKILDKTFELSIPASEVRLKVEMIADQINTDLKDKAVVFIVILNGAFIFASDLYKLITLDSRISFLKLASYYGTASSGTVKQLIGLNESIKDKTVVIVEDIVDSGKTLDTIIKQLNGSSLSRFLEKVFLNK